MCLGRESDREITTTKRGKRIATSIEGTLTGLGGNLIVIDDPLKLSPPPQGDRVRRTAATGLVSSSGRLPI
jgi:hypothetical protein